MIHNNNNTNNGRCLTKHHNKYGNMYLNINNKPQKDGITEYYIRTKNNGVNNRFKIPNELNNKDLKLFQALKIIEEYNNNHPHDIGIKTACTSPKIQPKLQQPPPKNEQQASFVLEKINVVKY